MAATTKRLQFFEQMTASGSNDPMAWYGLAQEYRSLERFDEALATFTKLRASHPDYVAMYLMAGQMLDKMGRKDDAREWLTAGVDRAQATKNQHALGELQDLLASLA
jgi:predicted Zn-dependent protease